MNILFLGRSNTPLSSWYINSLKVHSEKTVVLNTHPSLVINNINGFNGKIYNLYENRKGFHNKFSDWVLFYPRMLLKSGKWYFYDKETTGIIVNILQKEKIDIIFAWWGADVLYELSLICSSHIKIKIVWALIVFPSSLFLYNRVFENILTRRVINKVDGVIYGSEIQRQYVKNNFCLPCSIEERVFTQTSVIGTYFKKRLHKLSNEDGKLHIVFIGRTDFSRDPRRVKDDIRYLLEELEDNRIIIHIAKTNSKITAKNIQYFESYSSEDLSNGNFATFLTQFDLCLVAYNYRDTRYHERFDTGIPARMTSAISAGISVIIPDGTMKACAEFVVKNEIGFTYTSVEDLIGKFKSEKFQEILQNAENKVFDFSFEREFGNVNSLMEAICNG